MTCVFLSEYFTATQKIGGQFYSLMESRIRDVISELCAVGLRHKGAAESEIGVVSTLASWCVCGVAFDWYRHRLFSAERMVEMALPFVIRVCKTA